MAGKRSSPIKCLLKRSGEFSHAFFRHLPLVVVGAVTRAASRLLLAAHVQAKVLRSVIRLVAVHMVDAFFGRKRPAEMCRHDKSVFHDRLTTMLHFPKHREQAVRNRVDVYKNVAVAASPFSGAIFADIPSVCSVAYSRYGARAAKALKVISLGFSAYVWNGARSSCITARASNVNNKNSTTFSFYYPHFFANGWVRWQWRRVWFSWHMTP